MSSTNKTTNYELSQFIGTDKPAWLTDYNQDMTKIDAGIHTAQATATGADGKADANSTNIGDMSYLSTTAKNTLVAAINEVDNDASSAYNLASNASQTAQAANTKATTLESKFNFGEGSDYLIQITGNGTLHSTRKYLTIAKNSDGSICKAYGWIVITNPSNITKIKVTGTGLSPTSEFTVKCAGIQSLYTLGTGDQMANTQHYLGCCDLTYKTNGDIEISVPNSTNYYSNGSWHFFIPPTVTFVKSFGDNPNPQD